MSADNKIGIWIGYGSIAPEYKKESYKEIILNENEIQINWLDQFIMIRKGTLISQVEQIIKKYKDELINFSERQKERNGEFLQAYKGTNKDECYGLIDGINFNVCNRFEHEELNTFYEKFRNELFGCIAEKIQGLISKEIIIDGNNFNNIEEFYCEIDKVLTKDLEWKTGHNFDAFNDLLRGGFGISEDGEPLIIKWKNYKKSKKDLGNDTILTLLEIINDFNNSGHQCKLELY